MNEAQLYKKSNALQRRDAKKVLEEFAHLIQWNGGDSVLDVGCGSGDVTVDFVLPQLPDTFSRLVGVDISGEMVKSANEAYQHPRMDFKVLNISGSVDQFVREMQEFDHVMSFYCLHWVQNQK
jgi:juvenile hormone-III synthase